jgi:hypothetical protein
MEASRCAGPDVEPSTTAADQDPTQQQRSDPSAASNSKPSCSAPDARQNRFELRAARQIDVQLALSSRCCCAGEVADEHGCADGARVDA